MIPRSLSATALHVAELCMARWFAENVERGRSGGGDAARLGSSVHGALEYYVKAVHFEKNNPQPGTLALLQKYYDLSYMTEFTTAELSGDLYTDGWEMLKKWWARTSFEGVEVLSCEVKEFFEVKFPDGTLVPFNFIWDRFDRIGPNEYKVVDYKSFRWALRADDLAAKIQARFYALAVQIKYPDAEKIWVEFDQLRHDPIGLVFTKQDNIDTWRYLKRAVQRIYDYDENSDITESETLNDECRWCVRKVTCTAVRRNAAVGGIHSWTSIEDAIEARAKLEYQAAAAKSAVDELDKLIIAEAKERDELEFVGTGYRANIGMSSRRAVDGERAEMILGPELFRKYGSTSINLADIDKLLKGNEITPEQKKQLDSIVYRKLGEPKVKIQKVTMFGDKE